MNVVRPLFRYAVFNLETKNAYPVFVDAAINLAGQDICRHLDGAKKAVVLAVTLGAAFDAYLLRKEKISMTEAVIADAVGSSLAESVADYCTELIAKELRKENLYINYRYSPGYGDFPLSCQKDIINALSCDSKIGLTVSETYLLLPRKSITAVIGVFDKPQNNKEVKCTYCNLYATCSFRREGICCDR